MPWSVWFTTNYYSGNQPPTCIVQVEIDIENQTVVFGMNGYFRVSSIILLNVKLVVATDYICQVNGLNVIAPWYYPAKENATVWVVNYGSTGHTLNTIDLVSVTFSGANDYSMVIQIPKDTYYNDTEGLCGNSNGNPNDDPTCPDGDLNTCFERNPGTTTPHTGPPLGTTTIANYPSCDNTTQQQINQECSIILNYDGPFAACAANDSLLAIQYYSSCAYDLCYAVNESAALCSILQSYADACMQDLPNVVLSWRNSTFCRKFYLNMFMLQRFFLFFFFFFVYI